MGPQKNSSFLRMFIMLMAFVGAIVFLPVVVSGGTPWSSDFGRFLLSFGFSALAFQLCMVVLRGVLNLGYGMPASALVLVEEGLRRRLIVFCSSLIFIANAVLARWIHNPQSLTFELRNYLLYALFVSMFVTLLFVLLTGCGSIAHEVRNKIAHNVLVKPLPRFSYLFGKWIGCISVGFCMLLVAGAQIFIEVTVKVEQCDDAALVGAATSKVLSARIRLEPYPAVADLNGLLQKEASRRLRQVRGEREREQAMGAEGYMQWVRKKYNARWRSLPEDEVDDDGMPTGKPVWRSYMFDAQTAVADLLASGAGQDIFLRLAPRLNFPPADRLILIDLQVGDFKKSVYCFANQENIIPLPAKLAADAPIVIKMHSPEYKVRFSEAGSLQLLVDSGSFSGNLLTTMFILWLKCCFIAAFAVASSSLLSFQVAGLASSLLAVAVSVSRYLLRVAEEAHARKTDGFIESAVAGIEQIGLALSRLLSKYGQIDPVELLVDGVSVQPILPEALFWILGVWAGLCLTVAVLLFQRRELARVQV